MLIAKLNRAGFNIDAEADKTDKAFWEATVNGRGTGEFMTLNELSYYLQGALVAAKMRE